MPALELKNRFHVNDLLSGVVVFLVALPLCLGIALASGAPIISGIIAGIVGGIIVGLLSGSHISVSGPAAGLTAVILVQLDQLGGNYAAFLLCIVFAGILQILCILVGFLCQLYSKQCHFRIIGSHWCHFDCDTVTLFIWVD